MRTAHFKEPFLHDIILRMDTCKDMFIGTANFGYPST